MNVRTSTITRRNFLLAIGAGGAATAAAVATVATRAAGHAATQSMPPHRDADGYRVSEHVSNYYRTTRV